MMTKRILTAVIVALVVSGLVTYVLSERIAKNSGARNAPKQEYVAVATDIEAGEVLTPQSLQLVDWNGSGVLTGGFTKVADLSGRVVLFPLAKGELILERQLASVGSAAGLTAKIPPGMRAIAVRSDDIIGVAGFLLPGTHVDVLMTYHSGNSPEPETVTVLQDVVVLSAGQQIHPDPAGKPATVNVVTLLLSPENAEKMALATSLGGVYFVLRNGGDQEKEATAPIGLGQLTGKSAPVATINAGTTIVLPTKPKTPSHYDVDTFLGDKETTKSFN
jgi:pilus assembly protein CpaB